jgi:preprotein translocase subunit SecG
MADYLVNILYLRLNFNFNSMYYAITAVILATCILLVLVVLVQNSKGGGLTPNLAGGQQIMGVRRTTDFLEKATWWLASVILVLSFAATMFISSSDTKEDSQIKDQIENSGIDATQFGGSEDE